MKEINDIKGITCDSRKVKSGYIFVAIKGLEDDGNNYIDEAIANGASLVITDQPTVKTKIPTIKVDNARKYLGKLAAEFYNKPSQRLNVIGVTGTNGKTTTTHLIYNLLNYETKKSGLIGTVKVDTGQKLREGNLTTPPPVLLQKYLSNMVKNQFKYCCMEVSSHGIYLKRISGTDFSVKVGTNITRDHFDLHDGFDDYKNVKKSFLQEDSQDSLVLLNQDDPHLQSLGRIAPMQVNYSIDQQTSIKAENISYNHNRVKFTYTITENISTPKGSINRQEFQINMQLPGKHNIYNALIAITIGLYYGLKPKIIQDFFKDYQGVWRRLQVIYNDKFTIIDDCAHNPGSYKAVFASLKNLSYKKIYIINAIRGNRGCQINKSNAETIANQINNLNLNNYQLITSNCNDTAKKDDIVKDKEEEAFLKTLENKDIPYTHTKNLIPHLEKVLNKAEHNDIILLLGPHAMDDAGKIALEILNHNTIYV